MNWYKMAQQNKELILMRGVSGSGKSFKARQLAGENGIICSADDFFIERGKGEYAFDPSLLSQAHQQCQGRATEAIEKGLSPVIIDNTNTRLWEMRKLRPIIQKAQSLGYSVRVEEPETDWWKRKDIDEMQRRNSHGVPREAIEKMIIRFAPDITIEDILED